VKKCQACGIRTRDYFDVLCFYRFKIGKFYDQSKYTIIEYRKKSSRTLPILSGEHSRYRFFLCRECARALFNRECSRCKYNWRQGDPTRIDDMNELVIYDKWPTVSVQKVLKPHPMAPRPPVLHGEIIDVGPYWEVRRYGSIEVKVLLCSGYEWTLAKLGYIK